MEGSIVDCLLLIGNEVPVGVQSERMGQLLALDGEGAGVKDLELAALQVVLNLSELLGGTGMAVFRSVTVTAPSAMVPV